MALEFTNDYQREAFIDDVLATLNETFFDSDKNPVQGLALSRVMTRLREGVTPQHGRWHNLRHLADLEYLLESCGFEVRHLRNNRGQKARVVTL